MANKRKKISAVKGLLAISGIVIAAIVSNKVRTNNPEGIMDENNDGKVDAKDYAREFKKAAKETYDEAKEYAKEKAPIVKEKAAKVAKEVKDYAAEKAPIVKEKATKIAKEVKDKIDEID